MLYLNSTAVLLFLAILPVMLILFFVYNKDKRKEPFFLLLRLFFFGILSCFLVLFVSDILELFLPFMNNTDSSSFIDTLLYCFIGVALVEETCKWIMAYFIGYNNKEFDEKYDIIVYSVFVSLGFAFFENILYILSIKNVFIAIYRGISAVPGHACDAVFMGYYLSLAKGYKVTGNKQLERKNTILSIVIPATLHGIYDFCLMSGYNLFVIVFLIFVIALYIISIRKLNEISSSNNKIIANKFCPNCGTKVEGNFCPKCGKAQN